MTICPKFSCLEMSLLSNTSCKLEKQKLLVIRILSFFSDSLHKTFLYHLPPNSKFNSFPHNPNCKQPRDKKLFKTLWLKEKMLVTSIFSFSHNIFHPSQTKIEVLIHIYFVVTVCKVFHFELILNFFICKALMNMDY